MAPRGHSFAVGGSSADRLLKCPANVVERLKLPPGVATDVAFAREAAEEGSRCHDLMEQWFVTGVLPADAPPDERAQVEKAYDMAMATFDRYMPGAEIFGVELEVTSFLPGCFGTTDLVMLSPGWIGLGDWKFGGWFVPALYGNAANPQLLFYLSALRVTYPGLFKDRDKFLLLISQPKCVDEAEHVVVGVAELDAFDRQIEAAFVEAMNPNPTYSKGDHCAFCAAKVICPKWTGPALDFSRLNGAPPRLPGAKKMKAYGEWLGTALTLLADINAWAKSVEPAAHEWIQSGQTIPGWKTEPKRATRKWALPEDEIRDAMIGKGYSLDAVAPRVLRSVAQLEKIVGGVPPAFIKSESSGINLVPDGKPPAVPLAEQADRLTAATAALKKET